MAARTAGRKGRPFRRAQAQCYAEETHCYFGDGYVDQTLTNYRSPRARSVHHLIPPDVAPELANKRSNMRLAHIGCNASYGRGQYQGQGSKGGRPSRGGYRGRARRVNVLARVGVSAGTYIARDRDW